MQAFVRNIECVKTLDITNSMCNHVRVRYEDIKKRLTQSHRDDAKELAKVLDAQNAIRSTYRQYLDLETRRLELEQRMQRTIVARGADTFEDVKASARNGADVSKISGIVVDPDLPLWQIMMAILEQYRELQVIELQGALESLDHGTSRSAIESALKTHRDVFQIRKSGRNRFVSLKGV